jgi:hypothetical protein
MREVNEPDHIESGELALIILIVILAIATIVMALLKEHGVI